MCTCSSNERLTFFVANGTASGPFVPTNCSLSWHLCPHLIKTHINFPLAWHPLANNTLDKHRTLLWHVGYIARHMHAAPPHMPYRALPYPTAVAFICQRPRMHQLNNSFHCLTTDRLSHNIHSCKTIFPNVIVRSNANVHLLRTCHHLFFVCHCSDTISWRQYFYSRIFFCSIQK